MVKKICYERLNFCQEFSMLEQMIKKYYKSNNIYYKKQITFKCIDIINKIKTNNQILKINYMISNSKKIQSELNYFNENADELDRYNNIILEMISNLNIYKLNFSEEFFVEPCFNEIDKEEYFIRKYYDILSHTFVVDSQNKKVKLSNIHLIKKEQERLELKYEIFQKNYQEISKIFIKLVDLRKKIASKNNCSVYEYYQDLNYHNKIEVREKLKTCAKNEYKKLITNYSKKSDFTAFYKNMITLDNKNNLTFNEISFEKNIKKMNPKFYKLYNRIIKNNCIVNTTGINVSYSTYLLSHNIPFILFNRTDKIEDYIYLAHEFGHCYQFNETAKKYKIEELIFPELNVSEIFSQIFEKEFVYNFNNKNLNIKYLEIECERILFYCMADEFQDIVYKLKDISISQIENIWKNLFSDYFEMYKIEDCLFLKNGKNWIADSLLFTTPYYSSNYFISDMIAMKNFVKNDINNEIKKLLKHVYDYDINDYLKDENITGNNVEEIFKQFIGKIEMRCFK